MVKQADLIRDQQRQKRLARAELRAQDLAINSMAGKPNPDAEKKVVAKVERRQKKA